MFPRVLGNSPPPPANDWVFQRVRNLDDMILKNIGIDQKLAAIFCNQAGEILEIMSLDPGMLELLASMGIKKNILMDENSAGTNAISLAINNQRTIVCHGAEHYLEKFHSLAGAASPIFDIDGGLRGFIGLYGVLPEVNVRLLRGLVVSIIQLFDHVTRLQRSKCLHDDLKKQVARIYKEDQKPMMMVSRTGYLRQMNPAAVKLLEAANSTIEDKSPDSLARFTPTIKEIAKTAIPCKDQPLEIRLSKKKLQVTYERIPLFSERDEFLGCLLIFEEQTQKSASADTPKAKYCFDDILGSSPALLHAKELAQRAAETSVNVFLHGPSGTGKEMFAHSIHNASDRSDEPFVPINCAAIPREIAESELFGYASGAFTGARKGGNIGKLEAADNGTVFLDEIGDMPLELQAKLLRLLEEKTITRVGGHKEIPVNLRFIAASNRNIPELIEAGKFREDLYYRLNVTSVNLPPLADCREDVPELVESFISYFNEIMGKKVPGTMPEIMERFKSYNWQGNIRELKNAIEFSVMLNSGEEPIAWKDLPGELRSELLFRDSAELPTNDPFSQERQVIQNSEKALFEKAIVMAGGNMSKAAKYLNVSRSTLYRKLKKFGLPF
jgi:transcriptional regulator with PAS, ATPase and Fis domain